MSGFSLTGGTDFGFGNAFAAPAAGTGGGFSLAGATGTADFSNAFSGANWNAGAATGTGTGTAATGTGTAAGGFDLSAWNTAGTTTGTTGGAAAGQGLNLGLGGTSFNLGVGGGTGTAAFVKPNTKYVELGDAYKQKYVQLEAYVQAQRKLRDEIADDLKKPIPREHLSVEQLNERLATLSRDIQKESKGLQSYIERVRTELKYAEQASRNLQRAKQQQTGAVSALNTTVPLPSQYHWEKLTAFSDSLDRITRQIEDIDQYLIATEQNGSAAASARMLTSNPKAFQQILGSQHTALCSLTSRVAQLHSLCNELRDKYRKFKSAGAAQRGGVRGGGSAYSYAYPSATPLFGPVGSSSSSASSAASLYDKVAGGGGSADLLNGGDVVFEGDDDDEIDSKGASRRGGGAGGRRTGGSSMGDDLSGADPFAELSFLNSAQSTSLVPPPVQTATAAQQAAQQAAAAQLAGTTGTGTAAGTGTDFNLFGVGGTGTATGTAAGTGTNFSLAGFGVPAAGTGTGTGTAATGTGTAAGTAPPAFSLADSTSGFNLGAQFSFAPTTGFG